MSKKRNSDSLAGKTKNKRLKNNISKLVQRSDDRITAYWNNDQSSCLPYLESDSSDEESSEANFLSIAHSGSEEQIEENSVRCYSSTNVRIIVLKKDEPVYISGVCRIQVLYGGVEVFGYELHPGNTVYDVFSVKGWSQMFLSYGFRTKKNCRVNELLEKYEFDQEVINEICDSLNLDTAVICCLPLDKTYLKYIEKCISTVIFPPETDGFQVHFNDCPTEQVLKIGYNWYNLVKYKEKKLKIVLCGGKSAGKSTLLRFMSNRLLTFHEKICIIDLDPGQPEFTMPGCISIVIMDKPVFGPNFTHQKEAVISILQNVDVSYTPQSYIEGVQELYKSYAAIENMPTLINTMGFTKGLGLEIISSVIAIVYPSVVIEIRSYKPNKDFPKHLTRETVYENCSSFITGRKAALDYEFVTLPACSEKTQSGFIPASYFCRDISTISYFGNILNRSLSLRCGSIPMYKINLDSVKVIDNEYRLVKPANKAAVINANIVALCSASNKKYIYICYGYGIVRTIMDNELFLITSVKDQMRKVTHLVVGIVQFPSGMLHEGMPYDKPTPYFSMGCLSEFISAPRRSYLPRKSI